MSPLTAEHIAPGHLLAGKYRIERQLGEGAMGAVFLAENIAFGRRVAIKVLLAQGARNPQVLARFRQEARASAAIGHPGIVDVLDVVTEGDTEFIVMELLKGETLGKRIAREAPLPIASTVEILTRLSEALEAAHEHGIVHRDLKPENVFLVSEPASAVKILDFGISKLTQDLDPSVRTQTGAVLGTPLYMSPEQVGADRALGPPTDLHALGTIAYEMLTGQPPFRSATWANLLLQILHDAPAPLEPQRPDVPPALATLVMQLLAKAPGDRPYAREVKERLGQIVAGGPAPRASATIRGADPALADTAAPAGEPAPLAMAGTSPASRVAAGVVETSVELRSAAPPAPAPRRRAWAIVAALLVGVAGAYPIVRRALRDDTDARGTAPLPAQPDARSIEPAHVRVADAARSAVPDALAPDARPRSKMRGPGKTPPSPGPSTKIGGPASRRDQGPPVLGLPPGGVVFGKDGGR